MTRIRTKTCLTLISLCALLHGCSSVPGPSKEALTELAPSGTLRAAINFGNPVLAAKDPITSRPSGVSIDIANALAKRLGVPLRLVPFDSAGSVVSAARNDEWDIAFVARDPARAKEMLQTAPYISIEGGYMVRDDSSFRSNDEVDVDGVRVAVGAGSAYDLYLSRALQHAKVVRAATSPGVTPLFLANHLDVAAGVKQQLLRDAAQNPGLRLLPGSFMRIDQAMATPLGHGAGAAFLDQFIAEIKSSGLVQQSLAAHKIEGVEVPP
jgi:polar amino acid transport system substrate-binding protein